MHIMLIFVCPIYLKCNIRYLASLVTCVTFLSTGGFYHVTDVITLLKCLGFTLLYLIIQNGMNVP